MGNKTTIMFNILVCYVLLITQTDTTWKTYGCIFFAGMTGYYLGSKRDSIAGLVILSLIEQFKCVILWSLLILKRGFK